MCGIFPYLFISAMHIGEGGREGGREGRRERDLRCLQEYERGEKSRADLLTLSSFLSSDTQLPLLSKSFIRRRYRDCGGRLKQKASSFFALTTSRSSQENRGCFI